MNPFIPYFSEDCIHTNKQLFFQKKLLGLWFGFFFSTTPFFIGFFCIVLRYSLFLNGTAEAEHSKAEFESCDSEVEGPTSSGSCRLTV